MVRRSTFVRLLTGFASGCVLMGVAACQPGGGGKLLDLGAKKDEPNEGKVLASELLAYCPKVTIKADTGYFNKYAKGGDDDPAKLSYQASIGDVTRSCNRSNGVLTMNIAVAGRVVPGPAGSAEGITLPIRVAVIRGDEVLYSQIHNYPVSIGAEVVQFVFNDPNVSVPIPAERSLQVFAGFDAGPLAKKKQDAAF